MRRVVFCNTPGALRQLLTETGGGAIEYLVFTCDAHTGRIEAVVREQAERFRPADVRPEARPRSSTFQQTFVDFVANVNRSNAALFWWGLNFTNKNPITTQLCDRTSRLLQIADMVEAGRAETYLVVSDDPVLVRQVRRWAGDKDIRVTSLIRPGRDVKGLLKRTGPWAILAAFFRAAWRAVAARGLCPRRRSETGRHNVVLSLLAENSFTRDGAYHDAYFGDLVDYLRRQDAPLLNLLIVTGGGYGKLIGKLRDAGQTSAAVLERFLGPMALLRCLARAMAGYLLPMGLRGPAQIAGIDVRYLVEAEMREDYRSGRFFDNVRVYHAVRSLLKSVPVGRFYYPFENRAFEKMALQALEQKSPDTRTIGYQHASLSLRHTNFLLAEGEASRIPLPDVIMTMGEVTRRVMINSGNFPESLLHVGCALRQKAYEGELKVKRPVRNLFVVLATNVAEYVKVLRFLDAAFGTDCPYEIWIRPHPAFSFDHALAITGPPGFEYHKADAETINECMDWADVVLYVHSTVAIESLARGTPVVCLQVPDVLNPDPMLTFHDFKWEVDDPPRLPEVLREIDALDAGAFARRQQLGVAFTREYFQPADEDALAAFLTV